MKKNQEGKKLSASFITGAIALVFLAIGWQTALFVHKAAVTHIAATRDRPDTVYIYATEPSSVISTELSERRNLPGTTPTRTRRKEYGGRSPAAKTIREQTAKRTYECFPFDPNTVSVEELIRLGFSEKQARSIDNYRKKGGRFRRKTDFAKSYVVADSVFARLEPYIDIPKLDINTADSAAFDALPGIGPYFAAKMVSYRKQLKGYSYPEQLMDIYHFDQERFDALSDLITVGASEPYPLWSHPEDSLKKHPYIGSRAHGIVLFREHNPPEKWTVEELARAGVLSPDQASRLSRCSLASTPIGDARP